MLVAPRVAAAIRLALVLAAVVTLGAYTVSSSAGLTPVESSRYLSCLLISLPALLWPVWTVARRGPRPSATGRRGLGRTLARPVALALLAATLGTAAQATWRSAQTAPATRAAEARHTELVSTLRQLGVRQVRAGYWTCNRLTFASAEQVVCAVVDDALRPGFDRYPAYRREVDSAAAPAWVAPAGSPLANALDERQRANPGALDLVTIDGWRIYLPHVTSRVSVSADDTVRVSAARAGSVSRPRRWARAAASTRLVTSSFAMIRETCTLAVFGEMNSCSAIRLLLCPSATSRSTSRSRAVSRSAPAPPWPVVRRPTRRARVAAASTSGTAPSRRPISAASVTAAAVSSRSPAAAAASASASNARPSGYGCPSTRHASTAVRQAGSAWSPTASSAAT